MNDQEKDLYLELLRWFEGARKVVIAGIGNPIRSDDQIGLRIVEAMRNNVPSDVHLIECETVPESFVDEIVEVSPTHVLLIDAALIGLAPGGMRLYEIEMVSSVPSISTHTLPIRVFSEYVRVMTGAKVALLLIEPRSVEFGEGMSEEAKLASERVKGLLVKVFEESLRC